MSWQSKLKQKLDELRDDDGYFVYDLNPDKAQPKERYQFSSSTTAGLVNQISSFLALREYHESKRVWANWEEFEKAFILCFPSAANKSAHWGNEQNPWGRPAADRPKFQVLQPPGADTDRENSNNSLWIIEFWPIRSAEEDSHLLIGNLSEVINQTIEIMQMIKVTENLYHVNGDFLTEHLKRAPKVGLTIKITFSNYKEPPFFKSSQRPDYIKHEVQVPFCKKAVLQNYALLKSICGGTAGLEWGRRRATAYIALDEDDYPSNKKGMPQLWCGGSTDAEAKKNVKQLMQITEAKIINLTNSGADYREGVNAQRLQDEIPQTSYKIYPAFFTIENTKIVEAGSPRNATPAKKTLLGKLNKKRNKFWLWFQREPIGYQEAITELTRWDDV